MKIGMIGLGRMGANMVLRLMNDGHECVVYDLDAEKVNVLTAKGAVGAASLEEMVHVLPKPRSLWLMLPAGKPTETTLSTLAGLLESEDLIVEGGNSYYKEDVPRAKMLAERGIHYLDVGLSGGIWGLEHGYSIMIGGEERMVQRLESVFSSLAESPDQGWGRVGPTGAGHYVKMVHNGMIYGLLQAYAEGFELLSNKKEYALDLKGIADMWRYSSVARSWLLDLISSALEHDQSLEHIASRIADSGEGRWTVIESIEQGCSVPVISAALLRRFRSQEPDPFADKLIAKLRNLFGGHELPENPSETQT
jgi:6-phosphogluconate dehydrogenase